MIEKRGPLVAIGISLLLLGLWRMKSVSAVPASKIVNQEANSISEGGEQYPDVDIDHSLLGLVSNAHEVLLLGDSQIAGKLGDVLEATIESINPDVTIARLGIPGVSPKKLLSNAEYKTQLNQLLKKPSIDLIIIQLGDNGINREQEVLDLLSYINQKLEAPPKIVWVGAHPKTFPIDRSTNLVLTSDSKRGETRYVTNYNELVKQWNSRISRAIGAFNSASEVFFVDPFSMFPYKDYNMTQMSFDGVHILEQPAKDFTDVLFSKVLV